MPWTLGKQLAAALRAPLRAPVTASAHAAAPAPNEGAANEVAAAVGRALRQRTDPEAPAAGLSAAALASRKLLADRWAETQRRDAKRGGQRRVHYLSMEFLMGRALSNALAALQIQSEVSTALAAHGHELAQVAEAEPDAALGNGGLGRLAACFLDAMATLEVPSFGYGLRYENGMFRQQIEGGQQVEVPDNWLRHGNPWEMRRAEIRYAVSFGGVLRHEGGQTRWQPAEQVIAQAVDFIVPGHDTQHVSTLRQWQVEASQPIDLALFCRGEHAASGAHALLADTLNWVLYPDDSTAAGRTLRLKQEFVLVSASLQDMLARHQRESGDVTTFGHCNAVHLNDTHPALSPVELMRLLLDEHGLDWDRAWAVTHAATSYTNHTLMPEALETWPVQMLQSLLPRHLEIINEINHRFLAVVRAAFPGDEARVQRLSVFDEAGERRVRMATLAIVCAQRVNGVSALHSRLMVETIFADWAALWPERFLNVTNGVTPRRWVMQANPDLAALFDRTVGLGWRRDLSTLRRLAARAADPVLHGQLQAVKRANKQRLAELIQRELGLQVNVDSLFDVQIKRIHEYKRQLLNVLHVIARWLAIVANPDAAWTPRTVIFAGKAASAYHTAKLVIQLIHDVARVVNNDPRVSDRLKVVFLPNYSVSLAERIIPAADLSEQISTAGTEASGTGNMKFALNGALTLGTWDGANIEMAEAMGVEQMFIFGLREAEVRELRRVGYDPRLPLAQSPVLQAVLDAISSGVFSPGDPTRYHSLADALVERDTWLLLADFASYHAAQDEVDALFGTPQWSERVVRNMAGMGVFSVDNTIRQYLEHVWRAPTDSGVHGKH